MKHKVLIRRCDEYDADRIRGIVKEGMEELGVRPSGRVLLQSLSCSGQYMIRTSPIAPGTLPFI